jgi:hypothetical protein
MNEIVAKLYDKAIVIEDGGDYVCGELDPEKFAELIVRRCAAVAYSYEPTEEYASKISQLIQDHFGVEE